MLHNKKGGYNSIPLTNALWVPEQYKQIVHDNEKAEMSICTSVTIHSQASIIIKSKKTAGEMFQSSLFPIFVLKRVW